MIERIGRLLQGPIDIGKWHGGEETQFGGMARDEFRHCLARRLAEITRIGIITMMDASHRERIHNGAVDAEIAHGLDQSVRIAVLAQGPRRVCRPRTDNRLLIFGQYAMMVHIDKAQSRAWALFAGHLLPPCLVGVAE